MFYQFVLNMWIMARVDETWVQAVVTKYITQEECDMILLTPQTPGTLSKSATETI